MHIERQRKTQQLKLPEGAHRSLRYKAGAVALLRDAPSYSKKTLLAGPKGDLIYHWKGGTQRQVKMTVIPRTTIGP